MHDVSEAEKIYEDGTLIGYVKQATPDLWVPIDTDKMTISGPSNKADATLIVRLNHKQPINK